MYLKKKSAEGYFVSSVRQSIWKKGKTIFEELSRSVVAAPDGRYEALLVDAGFEISRGRPLNFFIFQLPGGGVVKKAVCIDNSEGIASVFLDLSRIGITVSNPVDLEAAHEKIRKKKALATITVSTSSGLRHITIEEIRPLGLNLGLNREAEAVPEIPKTVAVAGPAKPKDRPPVPAGVPPPDTRSPKTQNEPGHRPPAATPPPAPPAEPVPTEPVGAEVDIKPGDKIVFALQNGSEATGRVLKTFDAEYELAIELEDGNKMIVSGKDVIRMA